MIAKDREELGRRLGQRAALAPSNDDTRRGPVRRGALP
jgi:hypothetical protein